MEPGAGGEAEPLNEDAERDVSGSFSDSPSDSRFRQQGRRRRMRLERLVASEDDVRMIRMAMQNFLLNQSVFCF